MKKKLFLAFAMVAVLICLFTVIASAETTDPYIEFKVKLSGETDYVNAYAPNSNSSSPALSLDSEFYSDNDLTTVISKDDIVGMDLSNAAAKNSGKTVVTSFTTATTPFANCKEIKWFGVKNSCTTIPASAFQSWTALESFDFGITTKISDSAFKESGITSVVIPAGVTLMGSEFYNCKSLKSVTFAGAVNNQQYFKNNFYGCSALETLDLGSLVALKDSMFKNCTSLKSVVFPSTLTSIAKNVFEGCTALESVDLGNLKSTNEYAFKGCTSLKELTLPSTFTTASSRETFAGCISLKRVTILGDMSATATCMFDGCTALEYVDIQGEIGTLASETFQNCTSLKAISLPEGLTTIKSRAFNGCTSLQAVYFPSTLTTIGHESDWERGTFKSCTNLYFVEKPFSVKDENGNWLGENFVQPTKESVYYMPSGLTTIVGCVFRACSNINDVVVLPKTLTSITVTDGAFASAGTAQSPKTIVLLGDMEDFYINGDNNRYDNISFLFANPKDKGIEDMTFKLSKNIRPVNSYAYFCASKTYYDLSTFAAASHVVVEGEYTTYAYTEDLAQHIRNPKADAYKKATCTTAEGNFTFCFCGAVMTQETVEGSVPLGHNKPSTGIVVYFPLLNGAPNYFEDAHNKYNCSRCNEEQDEVAEGTALFVGDRGYSYEEDGTSILYRLHVNVDNIKAYSDAFRYGIIVSGTPSTAPITLVDGAITYGAQTLVFEMQSANYEFDYIQAKVTNIGESTLNCQAYAIDNNVVTYIGHNNVNALAEIVTYDAIVNAYGTTSGETKEN